MGMQIPATLSQVGKDANPQEREEKRRFILAWMAKSHLAAQVTSKISHLVRSRNLNMAHKPAHSVAEVAVLRENGEAKTTGIIPACSAREDWRGPHAALWVPATERTGVATVQATTPRCRPPDARLLFPQHLLMARDSSRRSRFQETWPGARPSLGEEEHCRAVAHDEISEAKRPRTATPESLQWGDTAR
jgi:hypothetical protein